MNARIALILLVAMLTFALPAHAAQVQNCSVQPGAQCTITFNLNNGDQVSGSISVTGGSGNDVNFWITSPSGATIYNAGRISGGTTFSLSANQSGAYIVHFDNSFSLLSSKQVTLSYDVSSTIIPGTSPTTSYIVLIAVVILLVALVVALRRRSGRKQATQATP